MKKLLLAIFFLTSVSAYASSSICIVINKRSYECTEDGVSSTGNLMEQHNKNSGLTTKLLARLLDRGFEIKHVADNGYHVFTLIKE